MNVFSGLKTQLTARESLLPAMEITMSSRRNEPRRRFRHTPFAAAVSAVALLTAAFAPTPEGTFALWRDSLTIPLQADPTVEIPPVIIVPPPGFESDAIQCIHFEEGKTGVASPALGQNPFTLTGLGDWIAPGTAATVAINYTATVNYWHDNAGTGNSDNAMGGPRVAFTTTAITEPQRFQAQAGTIWTPTNRPSGSTRATNVNLGTRVVNSDFPSGNSVNFGTVNGYVPQGGTTGASTLSTTTAVSRTLSLTPDSEGSARFYMAVQDWSQRFTYSSGSITNFVPGHFTGWIAPTEMSITIRGTARDGLAASPYVTNGQFQFSTTMPVPGFYDDDDYAAYTDYRNQAACNGRMGATPERNHLIGRYTPSGTGYFVPRAQKCMRRPQGSTDNNAWVQYDRTNCSTTASNNNNYTYQLRYAGPGVLVGNPVTQTATFTSSSGNTVAVNQSYQWQYATPSAPDTWVAISGATSNTYTPPASQLGNRIRLQITATATNYSQLVIYTTPLYVVQSSTAAIAMVQVPDLAGYHVDEATAALEELGFQVAVVEEGEPIPVFPEEIPFEGEDASALGDDDSTADVEIVEPEIDGTIPAENDDTVDSTFDPAIYPASFIIPRAVVATELIEPEAADSTDADLAEAHFGESETPAEESALEAELPTTEDELTDYFENASDGIVRGTVLEVPSAGEELPHGSVVVLIVHVGSESADEEMATEDTEGDYANGVIAAEDSEEEDTEEIVEPIATSVNHSEAHAGGASGSNAFVENNNAFVHYEVTGEFARLALHFTDLEFLREFSGTVSEPNSEHMIDVFWTPDGGQRPTGANGSSQWRRGDGIALRQSGTHDTGPSWSLNLGAAEARTGTISVRVHQGADGLDSPANWAWVELGSEALPIGFNRLFTSTANGIGGLPATPAPTVFPGPVSAAVLESLLEPDPVEEDEEDADDAAESEAADGQDDIAEEPIDEPVEVPTVEPEPEPEYVPAPAPEPVYVPTPEPVYQPEPVYEPAPAPAPVMEYVVRPEELVAVLPEAHWDGDGE